MSTAELPDEMIRYLQIRDRRRADVVEHALAAMTERERRLVREATVMGYVRGAQFGASHGRNAEIPADSRILAGVVDACLAIPDLYPVISSLTNDNGRE